jgi:uncharacterized protein (TIGR02145 family)
MRTKLTKITLTAALTLAITFTTAFAQEKGTFTDTRDKKKYSTVKIGEQTWMAENLNFNAKGSKCYGEGNKVYDKTLSGGKALSKAEMQANCAKYGKLYDWATAMALPSACNGKDCEKQVKAKHAGICPKGWHLPTVEELGILITSAGEAKAAGKALKAKDGWDKNGDKEGNGTDDYGFSALPGGGGGDPFFLDVGIQGSWLTTGQSGQDGDWTCLLEIKHNSERANMACDGSKDSFSSVRCLKD